MTFLSGPRRLTSTGSGSQPSWQSMTRPMEITEMAIMAPIDLRPFEDHQSSIEADEASAGAQSSKYPSTIAGDLEKVYQHSDTTQPTSHSGASSDYVKSELEGKSGEEHGDNSSLEKDRRQPTAKLFSQFQESIGGNRQANFAEKTIMLYGTSRLWFLTQHLRHPTTFNLLCRVKLTGHIRFDDIDRCIAEVGNRHEVAKPHRSRHPIGLVSPTNPPTSNIAAVNNAKTTQQWKQCYIL